jgi:hypothetical protein
MPASRKYANTMTTILLRILPKLTSINIVAFSLGAINTRVYPKVSGLSHNKINNNNNNNNNNNLSLRSNTKGYGGKTH